MKKSFLSLFLFSSVTLAQNLTDLNDQLTKSIDAFDKNTKSMCYAAIPSESLCRCINDKLGWGVSIRDYVIIRTLNTDEEKFRYIQQFSPKYSPFTKENIVEILNQVNDAWSQCRQ